MALKTKPKAGPVRKVQPIGAPKKVDPKPWQDQLTGDQRNAYAALKVMLDQYGLGTLADNIMGYVKKGYDVDTTTLLLQETKEWKTRFAGNEVRRKAGMPVMSPAEYLQTETAMKQSLKAYGLPPSFYDSPADFANLIGQNISAKEVGDRAQRAFQFSQKYSSPEKTMLREYYGIDDSHIAAYFLDPAKGQALIERQATAAGYGGLAARQNLKVGRAEAESWADQGISQEQVTQGVETAASVLPDLTKLGARYGQGYTQRDATNEFVGGLASARRKREGITRQETAQFGGSTGAASFGGRDTGGF